MENKIKHKYNSYRLKRKVSTSSPIAEGQKSVLLCQLADSAWFTGSILDIDQRNGHIVGNKGAMEKYWSKTYEPNWEMVV